jgi:hypothetical protein
MIKRMLGTLGMLAFLFALLGNPSWIFGEEATGAARWDIQTIRAQGETFFVESIPKDDPLRPRVRGAIEQRKLNLRLEELSDAELVALCDYRAEERAKERPVEECPLLDPSQKLAIPSPRSSGSFPRAAQAQFVLERVEQALPPPIEMGGDFERGRDPRPLPINPDRPRGVEALPPPPAPGPSSSSISQSYWNSWFHEAGVRDSSAYSVLSAGKIYTLTFDLSPYLYSDEDTSVKGQSPSSDFLNELNKLPIDLLSIYIRPIIVGRGMKFVPGEEHLKRMDLSLDRLRTPRPRRNEGETLADYSSRVQAGSISLDVEATAGGCAAIALSIWNRKLDRPIDEYVHTVAIKGEQNTAPDCKSEDNRSEKVSPSHLSLLWQDPDGKADAALHFFEMKLGDTIYKAAVYGENGSVASWTVANSPTSLLGDINFLAVMDEARSTGNYAKVGEVISRVLFSADSPIGKSQAEHAKQRLSVLGDKALLFVKMVDAIGQNLFFPIGSLKAGNTLLGDKLVIVQPLPEQTYRQSDICITDNWTLGLPNQLEAVSIPNYDLFVKQLDDTVSGRLATIEQLKTYVESDDKRPSPEGLLLLAHHGNGNIWYDKKSQFVMFSDVHRRYTRGSIAVLAACSVGSLAAGEKRLALLSRLNQHGIDAFILSPYEVPAELGVGLAIHFQRTIAAAYDEMKKNKQHKGPTLAQLYDRTLESLRVDQDFRKVKANARYEFLLAGNSALRLCLAQEDMR